MRQCYGFGEFEHKCTNPVDPKVNPVWCPRCNKLRIEHINKRFDEMMKSFEDKKKAQP